MEIKGIASEQWLEFFQTTTPSMDYWRLAEKAGESPAGFRRRNERDFDFADMT
ncbi:MAG: hypothetical protein JSS49_15395 [Planctomycetes bacterium]|nr:hypothetical protein [Planctomycetota bacterium]